MKFTKFEKRMKGAVFEFGREFFLQRLEIMPVRSSINFLPNFSFTNKSGFGVLQKGVVFPFTHSKGVCGASHAVAT